MCRRGHSKSLPALTSLQSIKTKGLSGNRGTEKLNVLPKVTQQICGQVQDRNHVLLIPSSVPYQLDHTDMLIHVCCMHADTVITRMLAVPD